MPFSKVIFSLLLLFSSSAFAVIGYDDTPQDPVLVEGVGFKLKTSELTQFLKDAYRMDISQVSVTWSYYAFDPLDLIIPDSPIYREVLFTVASHRADLVIRCTLIMNPKYNSIRTTNCTSSPKVVVEDSKRQLLSRYTRIQKLPENY